MALEEGSSIERQIKVIEKLDPEIFPDSQKQELIDALRWSTESSGMSKKLLDATIIRHEGRANPHNTTEEIREVCNKINYTQEVLSNGRKIHRVNGILFGFPENSEFTFADILADIEEDVEFTFADILADIEEDVEFTMDALPKTNKYDNLQEETGMSKLSLEKHFEILGEFAQAMGIDSPIDYDFFKGELKKSQCLLEMFGDITGFNSRIVLKFIKDKGVFECLIIRQDCSGIDYLTSEFCQSFTQSFLIG